MKLFILGFAALLATGSVLAAAPVIHDKTGLCVHLDGAKVLARTDTYGQRGIVPARRNYLDSQGREHVLDYHVQGIGCASDN